MKRGSVTRNAVIVLAFAAMCFGVMEFLAINIGQPNPFSGRIYTLNAVFANADGVPTAADVQMAGVVVGKVTAINHDPRQPQSSVVTMQITDQRAVPVYTNGSAKVRPKTLLGEKYIDLSVGNANTAEGVPTGGYILQDRTSKDVSNDEIFNATGDPQTKRDQQLVLQSLDVALQQRGGDIQAILPQLTQVVKNLDPVARVYEKDQPQADHILVQLDTMMQALADEHVQVAGFLSNGNSLLNAISQRNDSLVRTLQEASNVAGQVNAAGAPTVAAQRAALAELAPTLQSANALVGQVVDPQAACGGRPCGVDKLLTGTLLGQIHYPNDQLTATSPAGEQDSAIWDSMFSLPRSAYDSGGATHSALNIVLSFHCDTVTTELQVVLATIPNATALVNKACSAVTTGNPGALVPPSPVPLPIPPLPTPPPLPALPAAAPATASGGQT